MGNLKKWDPKSLGFDDGHPGFRYPEPKQPILPQLPEYDPVEGISSLFDMNAKAVEAEYSDEMSQLLNEIYDGQLGNPDIDQPHIDLNIENLDPEAVKGALSPGPLEELWLNGNSEANVGQDGGSLFGTIASAIGLNPFDGSHDPAEDGAYRPDDFHEPVEAGSLLGTIASAIGLNPFDDSYDPAEDGANRPDDFHDADKAGSLLGSIASAIGLNPFDDADDSEEDGTPWSS